MTSPACLNCFPEGHLWLPNHCISYLFFINFHLNLLEPMVLLIIYFLKFPFAWVTLCSLGCLLISLSSCFSTGFSFFIYLLEIVIHKNSVFFPLLCLLGDFVHHKISSGFPMKTSKSLCSLDLGVIIPSIFSPIIFFLTCKLENDSLFHESHIEKLNLFWAYAFPQLVINPANCPPKYFYCHPQI